MWPLVLVLWALVALGGGITFTLTTELMSCASQILHIGMEQNSYQIPPTYNRNIPPGKNTTVYIGVNVNRVSGVDENKQEITLDIFLQVSWWEPRLLAPGKGPFTDLPWEYRQLIWMPDLYIYQLQSIKMLSVLQELASLRLYPNGTVSVNLGATITITCEMNFVLFPLDIQNCAMDFSSYKYTNRDVKFEWRDVAPWLGVGRTISVQRKEFRLPKYVVTFLTDNQTRFQTFGEGEHSSARLLIRLSRELRGHLLESYLPSALFVILSWGSFCVIPEIVPGRMVLLVTTLLTLVTMIDTVSSNSPDALELKCIEVWLISCTIFVFLALLEYFVVLFGIRYDKSWSKRRVEMRRAASMAQLAPPPLHQQRQLGSPGSGQVPAFTAPRNTEDEGLKQQFSHQTITRDSPIPDRLPPIGNDSRNIVARLADSLDRAVMFCGAQHGAIDRYALMVFPMCFAIFVVIYWTTYLHAAQYQ